MRPKRVAQICHVTDTNVLLAQFGDYLLTVEAHLEGLNRSGFSQLALMFRTSDQSASSVRKRIFTAHRRRFDKDMRRFCRYSAVTALYSLFEVRSRTFIADFAQKHPTKPDFTQLCKKHSDKGFVRTFRLWLESAPTAVKFSHPRLWNQLQDLQLIRNCIAHANGVASLSKKPQAIEGVVLRTRRIHLDDHGVLTIDAGFAFEVCERLQSFFRFLFQSSGCQMALPPGYREAMQKSFAGFEGTITGGTIAHNFRQTINLGGSL